MFVSLSEGNAPLENVLLVERGEVVTARRTSAVRLLVLLAVAATAFLLSTTRAEAGTPIAAASEEIVVAAGDTLWGVAVDHTAPGEDPRRIVAAIRQANDLRSTTIHPGDHLTIPG